MARSEPVGIVGYGLVGRAVAGRLRRTGAPILVNDPAASPRTANHPRVTFCARLAEICEHARDIIVAVYSAEQALAVLNEICAAESPLHPTTVWCCTTLDPEYVPVLESTAERGRVRFITYPLCGTSQQIRSGSGLGLLGVHGGDLSDWDRALVTSVTPKISFFGSGTQASMAKLAINLVLEISRSALAEGLLFAKCSGLDPDDFVGALRQSPARSNVIDAKARKMIQGDFVAQGRAAQSLKDVKLMQRQADRLGLQLPLLASQADLLHGVVEAGEGDLDSSAVIAELVRRARRAEVPA